MTVIFMNNTWEGFLNLAGIKQIIANINPFRGHQHDTWRVEFEDGRITEIRMIEYSLIRVDA